MRNVTPKYFIRMSEAEAWHEVNVFAFLKTEEAYQDELDEQLTALTFDNIYTFSDGVQALYLRVLD